jgi:hypothetical protein
MVWFRMDDSFPSHPKVLGIPRRDRLAAIGLWTLAGGWCAKQLTDGYLAEHMVDEIGGTQKAAATLVEVGLWDIVEGGYQFHDWNDYNPTREEVEADRSAARERMKRIRSGRSSREVRANTSEVRPNNKRSSEEVRDPRPDPSRSSSGTTDGRGKRATQIPADWEPKPVHLEIAVEYNLDPAFQLRSFRDYYQATGKTHKDWDAAFRVWLNKAKSFQRPAPRQSGPDWDAAMQRAEARTNHPNHLEIA